MYPKSKKQKLNYKVYTLLIGWMTSILPENSNLSEEIIIKAKKTLEKDFKPIGDMRASKNYRMEVAKNLLMKCFLEIKNNKLIRLNH